MTGRPQVWAAGVIFQRMQGDGHEGCRPLAGREQRLRRALAEKLFGESIGALAAKVAERVSVQLLGVTQDDDARWLGLRRRRRQRCETSKRREPDRSVHCLSSL